MDTQGHILVVDDDREIRMLVGDYLKKHGYRVSLAADGRQMREILAGSGIDLIVLDLMLPGEDGLSLCRDLRARSDLPVLMLTARTEPIDRVLGCTRLGPLSPSHSNHETAAAGNGGAGWPLRRSASTCAR
jgi:two-component system, OmpR family, response regulator